MKTQPLATFTFPAQLEGLQQVSTIQEIKKAINNLIAAMSWERQLFRYRISLHKKKYVYCKCTSKGCPAGLRYRLQDDGRLKLTMAKIHHQHKASSSRTIRFRAVEQYISELPPGMDLSTLRKIICPQFGISDKQFYYVVKKAKSQVLSFDELTRKLESQGYQVYTSSQERSPGQLPQLLLITNDQMKQNQKQYGEIVSFDLTFNLIKNGDDSGAKFKLGVFLALTAAKKMAPLAFVCVLHTTREVYVQMMRTFFTAMGSCPSVLVTDEEKGLLSALEELKEGGQFRGLNMLDCYHILHNIRKRLDNKQNIVLFSRLIHARNRAELQSCLEQAKTRLPQREQYLLDRFMERSRLYCYAHLPPIFMGFSTSTSPNEAFHSILKRLQPLQKDYSIAVTNCLYTIKEMNKKQQNIIHESNPLQEFFLLPELQIVRGLIAKPVFSQLAKQLALSLRLEAVETDYSQLMIREHSTVFTLRLLDTPEDDEIQKEAQKKWKCECQYEIKARLPCRHQLKAILVYHQKILPYISNYWITKPKPKRCNQTKERKSSRSHLTF